MTSTASTSPIKTSSMNKSFDFMPELEKLIEEMGEEVFARNGKKKKEAENDRIS